MPVFVSLEGSAVLGLTGGGAIVAKLPMPDLPNGPVRSLMAELHLLHARAGWPSARQMAHGLPISYSTVHTLMTKTTTAPKATVLLSVVERLAVIAPRVDVDATLDHFDALWSAAVEIPQAVLWGSQSRSSS